MCCNWEILDLYHLAYHVGSNCMVLKRLERCMQENARHDEDKKQQITVEDAVDAWNKRAGVVGNFVAKSPHVSFLDYFIL